MWSCHTCRLQWRTLFHQPRRFKSKNHWTNIEKRTFPRFKALEHFDDFYKSVFGDKLWRSLRLGLLCNNKYCAVINNYAEPEKIMQELENRGALNMRRLFKLQYDNILKEKNNSDLDDEETSRYRIQEMEDRIDSVILEKAKTDKMSSLYGQYTKADEDSENVSNVSKDPVNSEQYSSGSKSLSEGLKNAHMDYNRIIDPRKSVTAATLDEFIPCTKLKGIDNWISETQHYEFYKKSLDFPINVDVEDYLNFPEHLNIYTYSKSDVTSFPQPQVSQTGVLNYFILDGGSVLPILALDLQKGDFLLDMCGAPGGKTVIAMQTLMLDELVCNDISKSRLKRIERVTKEYFYNTSAFNKLIIKQSDAIRINEKNRYNKILVDAPCTNDRVSVNEDENNFFSSNRVKERLKLPEIQAALLTNALKLVVNGGIVVYSTCSLSPIQNDGVVQMALKNAWNETNSEFVVKNLKEVFQPASIVYHLGTDIGLKYGILVLPHLTANFGPMYISKIERIK